MASTKHEVETFNDRNNFSLWQRRIKNLLIQQRVYKALLAKIAKDEP
jgi:hypothetical protein